MRTTRSRLSRLASWGLFLGALFTVGTGFEPGSLTRGGCEATQEHFIRKFTVTVLDATTDAPISGARVTLGDGEGMSDAAGAVVFPDLFEGAATVSASHAGYASKSETAALTKSDPTWTIRLTPAVNNVVVAVPVEDISTFEDDPLTSNRRDDPVLFFESSAATLASQASIVTFIDLDLAVIPANATLVRVTLQGHLVVDSSLGPPGGGGNGGGDGGGNAPSRSRLAPRATQDEDVWLEAYGVLQPWSQDDLNFMNKPVDYTNDPVATGLVSATAPTDAAGLKAFTMDLTTFLSRVRSGALRAHGFFVAGRDIVGTGGAVQVLGMTSADYTPAASALKVTAEYLNAAGQPVEVSLR